MQRPRFVYCACKKIIANFNGYTYDYKDYQPHHCEQQTPEMVAVGWVTGIASTSGPNPMHDMLVHYMCSKIEQEFGLPPSDNETEENQEKLVSEFEANNG